MLAVHASRLAARTELREARPGLRDDVLLPDREGPLRGRRGPHRLCRGSNRPRHRPSGLSRSTPARSRPLRQAPPWFPGASSGLARVHPAPRVPLRWPPDLDVALDLVEAAVDPPYGPRLRPRPRRRRSRVRSRPWQRSRHRHDPRASGRCPYRRTARRRRAGPGSCHGHRARRSRRFHRCRSRSLRARPDFRAEEASGPRPLQPRRPSPRRASDTAEPKGTFAPQRGATSLPPCCSSGFAGCSRPRSSSRSRRRRHRRGQRRAARRRATRTGCCPRAASSSGAARSAWKPALPRCRSCRCRPRRLNAISAPEGDQAGSKSALWARPRGEVGLHRPVEGGDLDVERPCAPWTKATLSPHGEKLGAKFWPPRWVSGAPRRVRAVVELDLAEPRDLEAERANAIVCAVRVPRRA